MMIIRFPDDKAKRRALGFLPGRFSFKSWATGEMMVPENALPFLAVEGFPLAWKAQPSMSALRRYEILLPSQFNDGRPIPQDLTAEASLL